jgi:hypothetical protein
MECERCGSEKMWRLAEGKHGTLARQLWRCGHCEAEMITGYVFHGWTSSATTAAYHLNRALDAAVATAYRR